MNGERDSDWDEYYERVAGRPPRPTLLAALERFGAEGGQSALDLGCGDGRDTIELLRRGWRVLAIDAE
ncbi:MAG TPA: class I SAM-dependent methyltransferase, partial [Stellaceae bacterium]|nr:class I SAM-dependent methyltransferase [Stellaceae bacterium]